MDVFRNSDCIPDRLRGSVVAIGNFDGVHKGHRALLKHAAQQADAVAAPLVVLTFEPHPRRLFRPDDPPFRLSVPDEKIRLIEGLDRVPNALLVLPFDRDFSRKTAEAFIDEILVAALGARHVVVGEGFVFGAKRGGNVAILEAWGRTHGFGVTALPPFCDSDGEVYSSTRVRTLLHAGDMAGAAGILGSPFTIVGPVQKGDQRGRDLGFPTANMRLGDHVRPAYGVYAVRVVSEAPGSAQYNGVANLGIRPMWKLTEPLLETFLFDFSGDLYGQMLRVSLVERLRGEMTFDGVDALIAQMTLDTAHAHRVLSSTP